MSEFLYHYHPVEPATWCYLSSLLAIGLFFKFSRFFSIRNLDLLLLIAMGPGLLFVHYGLESDRKTRAVVTQRDQGSVSSADMNAARLAAGHASVSAMTEAGGESGVAAGVDPLAARGENRVAIGDAGEPTESHASTDETLSEVSPPLQSQDEQMRLADEVSQSTSPKEAVSAGTTPSSMTYTRGQRAQWYGYLWLFCGGGCLLTRLLADPTMVRRPLLEPNLSAGGLTFIGCSLFVFLMANVISWPVEAVTQETEVAQDRADETTASEPAVNSEGPGYALLERLGPVWTKSLVILAHLAVVVGMVLIGYWHFDNIVMGIGAATLYLMLPYTARMTNEIKHVLPAASLVWAVLLYRRPILAGIFLGVAGGITYYPLFLLPLWLSFYWPRGLVRFVAGVVGVLFVLLFVLFSSPDVVQNVRLMFGLFPPATQNLRGIWDPTLGGWNHYYRIPVLAVFVVLVSCMALWPAQKNLGTLLSCSAAIMVATQFWHGFGGGTYMAWYLPLTLLTVFRPNLEDRVALTVLAEGWLPRRAAA